MRFWLSEQDRRPDPAPARADARKAVAAGTAAWLVLLVGSLAFRAPLEAAGLGWFTGAAIAGVIMGVIGLVVVQVSRRRARQSPEGSTTG